MMLHWSDSSSRRRQVGLRAPLYTARNFPLVRRRVTQAGRGIRRGLFELSNVLCVLSYRERVPQPPGSSSNAGNAQARLTRVPFSLVTFFWASKRKSPAAGLPPAVQSSIPNPAFPPAARTTPAHRASCVWIYSANSLGVPPMGSAPSKARRRGNACAASSLFTV